MEPLACASHVPAAEGGVILSAEGDGASLPVDDDGAALLADAFSLFTQQRDAEALPRARAALSASPARADAWTLLGILEQRAGRPAEAQDAYRTALRLRPDYADAWTNLGNLLRDQDDRRGALTAFRHAMRLAPHSVEPAYNLGVALDRFGNWTGALAAFEAVVACAPEHVDGRWNRALALLRQGRFEEGFRDYEVRFRRDQAAPRACTQPAWDGRPLDGRTVLVWAEQGFGDALQFLRFVPAVAARGGRVVLEVTDGLQRLAARLPGVAAVTTRGSEPPPFDTHVALMSLPFTLATTDAEIASPGSPLQAPYLHADATTALGWRERLRTLGWQPERELAVGIVWATHPALRNAAERSPGWPSVRGLADVAGTRWFGLQKGAGREALQEASHAAQVPSNFVDLGDDIADFDDTAAIIANLDVVVTCDTAVAHLAGAMGKPTFMLLPSTPDWRHGLDAHTTPWYPTARLFRQTMRGDWRAPCAQVAAALSQTVETMTRCKA